MQWQDHHSQANSQLLARALAAQDQFDQNITELLQNYLRPTENNITAHRAARQKLLTLCRKAGYPMAEDGMEETLGLPHHRPEASPPQGTPTSFLELQEEQADWAVASVKGTPPAPRSGHCAYLRYDSLYIFGGCGSGSGARCYNDIHALDVSTLLWQPVRADGTSPHPASQPACASAGALMIVFGGYAGAYNNALHLFDADKRTWTRAKPAGAEPPKPRQGASLTRIAGNRYLLFGGV